MPVANARDIQGSPAEIHCTPRPRCGSPAPRRHDDTAHVEPFAIGTRGDQYGGRHEILVPGGPVRKLPGGGCDQVYGIVGLAHGARKWENRGSGKAEMEKMKHGRAFGDAEPAQSSDCHRTSLPRTIRSSHEEDRHPKRPQPRPPRPARARNLRTGHPRRPGTRPPGGVGASASSSSSSRTTRGRSSTRSRPWPMRNSTGSS